jgi:hypothetical protein
MRTDERALARAQRGSWNLDEMKDLGPQWRGRNRYLNPLHATRPRAIFIGGWLVLFPLLVLWAFVSGPRGMVPRSVVETLLILAFLPGVATLFYAFAMPRFFESQSWVLSLDRQGLTYRARSYWEPLLAAPEGWSARLDDVARVETAATAQWEPTRRALLGDKPAPREEVQAFLFMTDGSRRVIATVHGGRESMATLAHSIRSRLDQWQHAGLGAGRWSGAARAPASAVPDADPDEGFRL